MIKINRSLRARIPLALAVACSALALLWPDWLDELRAQGYVYTGSPFTIDICEVDGGGVVTVGGKVAAVTTEPSELLVFVSRGYRSALVSALFFSTFEGSTEPSFARDGQKVTVALIDPAFGLVIWADTCELQLE